MICEIILLILLSDETFQYHPKFKTMKEYYDNFLKNVDETNKTSEKRTWMIGKTVPDEQSFEEVFRFSTSVKLSLRPRQYKLPDPIPDIPESFDAQKRWPQCDSIKEIKTYDKTNCSVNWALTTAATISDRLCIDTNGNMKNQVSIMDILKCCKKCTIQGYECQGGNPYEAWQYWVDHGLVSRSLDSQLKIKDCNVIKKREKFFGTRTYRLASNPKQVQVEIMESGPVQAIFKVYEDYYLYKNGVYIHTTGNFTGGYDTVKLIGWGIENKIPYWLGIKVINEKVGKRGGVFKIIRGTNHCGILQNVIGGEAKSTTLKSVMVGKENHSARFSVLRLYILVFISYFVYFL